MNLPVMRPADRHRELVTDLAAEGPGLGKAKVMSIGRLAATDETRLRGHEFPVTLVAQPAQLWDRGVLLEIDGVWCGRS